MQFDKTLIPMGGWVSSLGIHAGVMAWLLSAHDNPAPRLPPAVVSFSVAAPESNTKTQTIPPLTPQTSPSPARSLKSLVRAATPAKSQAPAAKPATAETVDLSGVTLTAGDGAGWSSMTGNGQAMTGPIQPAVIAPPQTKTQAGSPTSASSASRSPSLEPVRLGDLADKPIPPPLNTKLLANYPPSAKRQGLSGTAKVLARVDADGLVRQASTLFESGDGFGAACQRTLVGSRWSSPRDKSGRAVATQIHYTCQFRVDGS